MDRNIRVADDDGHEPRQGQAERQNVQQRCGARECLADLAEGQADPTKAIGLVIDGRVVPTAGRAGMHTGTDTGLRLHHGILLGQVGVDVAQRVHERTLLTEQQGQRT